MNNGQLLWKAMNRPRPKSGDQKEAMMESVKAKLATARLASAEGQIHQLRASVEAEVAKRLT